MAAKPLCRGPYIRKYSGRGACNRPHRLLEWWEPLPENALCRGEQSTCRVAQATGQCKLHQVEPAVSNTIRANHASMKTHEDVTQKDGKGYLSPLKSRFEAVLADSDESRCINYRLRYHVFCKETGLEDPANFPDEQQKKKVNLLLHTNGIPTRSSRVHSHLTAIRCEFLGQPCG